jgi:hypothetical protein
MVRWALLPGAPPLYASFRRSRAVGLGPTIVQRIEALLLFKQIFQFDQRRSVIHRHDSRPSSTLSLNVVRALVLVRPVGRGGGAAVQRLRALPAASLVQRSVERRERLHREREVFKSRLVERLTVRALSSAAVPAEASPPRRRSAAADEGTPSRLARRSQRQVVDAPNLAPLRLVIARPAPAPSARAVPELSSPAGPRRAQSNDAAPAQPWTPPPALNLERLAEQVIDRIDRRVVAQRERMGRI